MKELWRNQTFRIIVGSDLLQQLAIWIRNMALLFFIMEQTNNDPVAVSLLTVLEYAPIFIFSFIGGALADRWNPKRTMIVGDLLSAASIAGIILLIQTGLWQSLFAAAFISAVVSQFAQPSGAKMFKRNVEDAHISAAIAITQSLQAIFLIAGPVIGTLVYTKLGVMTSLYSLTVLFLLSALLLTRLPKWQRDEEIIAQGLLADIKAGWKYVYTAKSLRYMSISFAFVGLGVGLIQPLEVFLVTERLQLDKEAVQYLSAAAGVGLLVGGGLLASIQRTNQKTILLGGILFLAVASIVEVLSTSFWLTLTMRFLSGAFLAGVNIVIGTLMIQLVEEHMIGRVNGIITPIFMGTMLLGSAFAGVLMEATSLFTVFVISAVCIVISTGPIMGIAVEREERGN
ncbi:MFS transporter [Ectobacillus antri]|uniref:MFS transporter n=1 Tax=Ectobacillus antri TaxID=2486280 RepID=A0ABT6H758_9BACI|nr:MFS transporter [Ectobacillus antri]MDG4658016.1 MFS transporter [Ectobacillus antri]MDG5755094.1 MFS transporter [Ectobacillus antri]